MVTDGSGNVNECYDFLPFGRMLTGSDHSRSSVGCYPSSPTSYTSELPEKFTEQERDEIQLDYFQARYLSAAQGRFSSPDSTGYSDQDNPQSWNLYAYTLNNPLLFVDRDGHDVELPNCEEEEAQDCLLALKAIRDSVGSEDAASRIRLRGNRITIAGDVSSFRGLSQNAARLADLVEDASTYTAEIASTGGCIWCRGGSNNDIYGGASTIPTIPALQTPLGYPAGMAYVDPSDLPFDMGRDSRGFIGGQFDSIRGTNLGEAMAHELLGHIWAYYFTDAGWSGLDNTRQAILAEDQVRRTDPARGLRTTAGGIEVLTEQDLRAEGLIP